jgi:hypothetical protein
VLIKNPPQKQFAAPRKFESANPDRMKNFSHPIGSSDPEDKRPAGFFSAIFSAL